jgi:hypothetical protein
MLSIITKLSLAALIAAGISFNAHALTITPATNPKWTGDTTANMTASEIAAIVGATSLTEVYKQDVGAGSDSGTFASSYKTTFSNTATDPSDALIEYKSGASITGGSIYLYVKDGDHNPAFYIFNITGWNGTDDIVLTGFWPDGGAISHVTILQGNGTSVPDAGGTLALMGLAISSLGLLRRKLVS